MTITAPTFKIPYGYAWSKHSQELADACTAGGLQWEIGPSRYAQWQRSFVPWLWTLRYPDGRLAAYADFDAEGRFRRADDWHAGGACKDPLAPSRSKYYGHVTRRQAFDNLLALCRSGGCL